MIMKNRMSKLPDPDTLLQKVLYPTKYNRFLYQKSPPNNT